MVFPLSYILAQSGPQDTSPIRPVPYEVTCPANTTTKRYRAASGLNRRGLFRGRAWPQSVSPVRRGWPFWMRPLFSAGLPRIQRICGRPGRPGYR